VPALHKLLGRIQAGDIVYIKAHPPGRELIVKAVAIVTEDTVTNHGDLGPGVCIRWIGQGIQTFHEAQNERYNVRNNTLYEELNPAIRTRILDLLLSRIQA